MQISYENSNHTIPSPQSVLSPPDRSQQPQPSAPSPYANDQETLLKLIMAQPNLAEQLVRQFKTGGFNPNTPVASPHPQPVQVQYAMQPSPYRQQVPVQIPQPRQPIQVPFQPTSIQQIYRQPQTTVYRPAPVQFQQQQQQPQPYFPQHQSQLVFQQPIQRSASPSVIHYLPNNPNQTTFMPQTQQYPVYQTTGLEHIPQQVFDQMSYWNISDANPTPTATDSIQQPITTNEVEKNKFYLFSRYFSYF